MNTISPPVAMGIIAEIIMPSTVLVMLKPMAASIVFLNDRLSFNAESPGMTRSATTRIVPITFIESTMVIATNMSKAIESVLVGIPITRDSSSSKTIANISLRKMPTNSKVAQPNKPTNNKSIMLIDNIEPNR